MKFIKITGKISLFLITTSFLSPYALSEITLDGSMGASGALPGPDYQITEDLGQRTGSNLFHSFGQFNINSAESATFSGSSGIQNVISRVTGGQSSTINGAFRSTIPNANIYFLNPSGVIFGENASLDVQGSFHASTADYLRFKDGIKFSTSVATASPILTIAAPEAFGFLDNTPASISVSGENKTATLDVKKDATLSLIGGDITLKNGFIFSPSGQINLVSVGSAGEAIISGTHIETASFNKMGAIDLVSNTQNKLSIASSSDSAGKIFIRGGQMTMDNTSIFVLTKKDNGGDIDIGLTKGLNMTNTQDNSENTSKIMSLTSAQGNSGNIKIYTAGLTLSQGSVIHTSTTSAGKVGNIDIVTTDSISLAGKSTMITSMTNGSGEGGSISVKSDHLDIRNGASITSTTTDSGHAGSLFIDSNNITLTNDNTKWTNEPRDLLSTSINSGIIDVKENGSATGNSGNITVLAKQLTVSNGAQISAINYGQGQSGDVVVESNDIHLTTDIDVGIYTSSISNEGKSSGGTGNLTITSHNSLRLDNGGRITTTNFGTGSSGDLLVKSNNIVLIGYDGQQKTGILNNKYLGSTKKPGDLTVNANNLTIKNGAQISSATFGNADAGNIVINSKQIDISSNGDKFTGITTQTQGSGNAADISIKTNHMVLSGEEVLLSAGVENSDTELQNSGTAGNILIHGFADHYDEHGMVSSTKAEHIIARDGALIGAVSSGSQNNTGNISINTAQLGLYNDSNLISSTNGSADSGNILISANDIVLNNSNIAAITNASGDAGIVEIKTDTLKMQNNSFISTGTSTIATGHGGDIKINVKDFDLNNSNLHAGVVESSQNASSEIDRAGNIVINAAGTINLENGSLFTSFGTNESAGNITIKGGNLLRLSGDSRILTAVTSGSGRGGDIFINTPFVVLDDSFITSKADEGNGGDITMTGHLFLSPLSAITASSKKSADGELNLKPVTNISGSITVLPESVLNVSDHLSDRCANRSKNNKNSFVIKSRGGIPLSPGKLMPSTLIDITTPIDPQLIRTNNKNKPSIKKQVDSFVFTNDDNFLAFNQQVDCYL